MWRKTVPVLLAVAGLGIAGDKIARSWTGVFSVVGYVLGLIFASIAIVCINIAMRRKASRSDLSVEDARSGKRMLLYMNGAVLLIIPLITAFIVPRNGF